MIEYTIFVRSNVIFSDQNARLLSYNVMELDLVKILLDVIEQTNFVRSYVFSLDNIIGDRPYKWLWQYKNKHLNKRNA